MHCFAIIDSMYIVWWQIKTLTTQCDGRLLLICTSTHSGDTDTLYLVVISD